MLKLKPSILYCKVLSNSLNCKLRTDATLQARRKPVLKIQKDPGLRHQKSLYVDDSDYMESLEAGDSDLADTEEADFSNVDTVFRQKVSEKKQERYQLLKKITAARFFKSAPQPQMLTHSEKEHIRYLHKEDPVQWNVKTLSESFPATPEIIKKVLMAKWKPSLERQKKMDMAVQRNWELLAEGKLEADPELTEHLKKFTDRRKIIAEQIKNPEFYLPEIKEEQVWNNGEMSSILANYEKAIDDLEKKHFEEVKSNMLTDGSPKTLETFEKPESNLDILHKKIEIQKKMRKLKGKESFTLGKMVKTFGEQSTFEELQENLLHKAEAKKPLTLEERAILDHRLSNTNFPVKQKPYFKNDRGIEVKMKYSENLVNQPLKGQNCYMKEKEQKKSSEFGKNDNTSHDLLIRSNKPFENSMTELMRENSNNIIESEFSDKEKKCIDQLYYEKQDCEINYSKSHTECPAEESVLIKAKIESDKFEDLDNEKYLKDKVYYNKEEQDIKNTAFWNTGRNSQDKAIAEREKRQLEGPKQINKITVADISSDDHYPERIKIPKSKQGSGLIFKVRDCYYDDDGEFLYRVPGMTK